jgi:hypothetical protein
MYICISVVHKNCGTKLGNIEQEVKFQQQNRQNYTDIFIDIT